MSKGRRNDSGERQERLLGEYRVLAELARGGMGRVYLARRSGQAGFERYFAIKVMHQQLNDDQNAVMMLLDEAHIASRLHHPNVVPVMDIGTFADGYYLVMDYVEGCSLQQLLKASPGERPVKAIISIMLDALRGLHAVHTLQGVNDEVLQVIHRDISPHNLMLGLDGACRVTDFGIAKARQRFTDTDVGVHKGKLAFMAPEQLRGYENLDARVDVWAAGVTLYAALTGVHPFRGENDAATVHALLSGEIPLPSTVGHRPPAALDEVIMRSLQRDPAARHASAQAFAGALREVALAENLLGSPTDVAAWVKATHGTELAERRRKLHSLRGSDEQTVTGSDRGTLGTVGSASLPKLWSHSEGGHTSISGPQLTVQNSWFSAGYSMAGLTRGRPRVMLQVGVIASGAVLAMALAFLLPGSNSRPAAAAPAAVDNASPLSVVVPNTADAARPHAAVSPPEPSVNEGHQVAVQKAQEAVSNADPESRMRRMRANVGFRPRKPSATTEAVSAEPAPAAQAIAPEVHEAPAPRPAAPSRPQASVEPNPYLLGE